MQVVDAFQQAPWWSYAGLLQEKAAQRGDQVFAHFQNEKITYAELDRRSNAIGNGLKEIGIQVGDKVAVLLPNVPEFLDVWFATEKIGAVMVPVNISLKGEGLRYILHHSDSVVAVVHGECASQFLAVNRSLPHLRQIISLDDPEGHLSAIPYGNLLSASSELPRHEVGANDMVAILYTSGTTGVPKGVVHRQGRVRLAKLFAELMGYRPDDVLYTFLPLFHANAQVLTVGVGLWSDASVAIDKRFTASGFWDRTRHYQATVFNYIGGVLPILISQPPQADDNNNPVRLCMGPGAPRAIWQEFEGRFALKIVEFWSSTEGGLTFNGLDGKPGSIGKPALEYNDVMVVDDQDRECPPGAVGEIVFRFREEGKSLEYYKMPEATQEKTRGDWVRSGDLGYRDQDDYYYYLDRVKDCIRRRGENISSWELETVINKHPAIQECAAYGVPSQVGEEEVMLAIVLKPGFAGLEPVEFLDWCYERMARYMVPRYLRFVNQLEKTETHRIQKSTLKAEGVTDQTWDRERVGYRLGR